MNIIQTVRDSGLLERFHVDISARVKELEDRVRIVSVHYYTEQHNELAAQPGVNRALPLLLLTDVLEKNAKMLDKRFPEPLLGQLDLVSLALQSQVPLFVNDLDRERKRLMEGSANLPTPDVPVEDIFTLFRRTKTLLDMHRAFCPEFVDIPYRVSALPAKLAVAQSSHRLRHRGLLRALGATMVGHHGQQDQPVGACGASSRAHSCNL